MSNHGYFVNFWRYSVVTMGRNKLIPSALFVLLLLAACGGGSKTTEQPPVQPPPPPPPPPTSGLDARPDNATCVAPALAAPGGSVDIADAFPNLPNIGQATKVLVEPVANPRWFVLRKNGQLVVFDPDNATSTSTFIDLRGVVRTASEGGLLGMAFHPDYPAVPEIFLSYTIDGATTEMSSVFSRLILDDVASPSAIGAGTVEEVILEVDQFASNHNGGDIAFGADRLLYIGLGDGGGANDPQNTGQDTTRLLGAMLRLDVIGTGAGYNIPGSNPFSASPDKCGPGNNAANCPEIYAWGLRNPWRWSFDPPTGDLWLADVGQGQWEEVDLIVNNGNYGWDCREGAHDRGSGCAVPVIDPVSEYNHANGDVSITGGFVYRGSDIPDLADRYVFADFASGRIWALLSDGMGGYTNEELLNTATSPSSFGVDQDGELYFTDYSNGRIMKLVLTGGGGGVDPVPDLLSATGCVDPVGWSRQRPPHRLAE
jgi:glucose/arabinose dehydrogenase